MLDGLLLSKLSVSCKIVISLFLCTIGSGYLFTTLQVVLRVGTAYSDIVYQYSANPQKIQKNKEKSHYDDTGEGFDPFDVDIVEPVSFGKLVHNRHIHVIVQSLLFFSLSAILMMTTFSEKVKLVLMVAPFAAVFLESVGMFLTRFCADQFAILILFSGTVMGVSFLLILMLSLYELWGKRGMS